MKTEPLLSSRLRAGVTIGRKLVSATILIVFLMNCRAPDDAPEAPAADQAQYSVDVRLSLRPATTTSQPPEADLQPFHSKDGRIHFTRDGRVVELYAWEDTDSADRRILKIFFYPPFGEPATAGADAFPLPATGMTHNTFKLILEFRSNDIRQVVGSWELSHCVRPNCRLSEAGVATVQSVRPFQISFTEVLLVPYVFSHKAFGSLLLEGEGRWEQTYGAPVTIEPWSPGDY